MFTVCYSGFGVQDYSTKVGQLSLQQPFSVESMQVANTVIVSQLSAVVVSGSGLTPQDQIIVATTVQKISMEFTLESDIEGLAVGHYLGSSDAGVSIRMQVIAKNGAWISTNDRGSTQALRYNNGAASVLRQYDSSDFSRVVGSGSSSIKHIANARIVSDQTCHMQTANADSVVQNEFKINCRIDSDIF
jgi:hypothetical protein